MGVFLREAAAHRGPYRTDQKETPSGLRYIGSKARIVAEIASIAGPPRRGRFVDALSGTGVVSAWAARRGWSVLANDHLEAARVLTRAKLIGGSDARFTRFGEYAEAVRQLNATPGLEGFVFREYSPSGQSASGDERRYFTRENAMRIDARRAQIAAWHAAGCITDEERDLLVADLLIAASRVANIAGTYGCFLRHWTANALRPIHMEPRTLEPHRAKHIVTRLDCFEVRTAQDDLLYLDPPYTKRQYAAYYHILETIAQGDEPRVAGVTGLRPWRAKASPFCYKRKALDALMRLVEANESRRQLISYSDEGHIALAELTARLSLHGDVRTHKLGVIGRYRPNLAARDNRADVSEYLIELRKMR